MSSSTSLVSHHGASFSTPYLETEEEEQEGDGPFFKTGLLAADDLDFASPDSRYLMPPSPNHAAAAGHRQSQGRIS